MEHIKNLFDFIKDNRWDKFIEYLQDYEDIDVNVRDDSNNYLINYAIIMNNIDAVSLLIHRGSKLDMMDQDGRSILFIPIKFRLTNILNLLLHFNRTNIGISLVDMRDKFGHIPLHYSIMFKNIEAIKLLLNNGSDVNREDNKKQNSLHHAIYSENIEICKLILKTDININSRIITGENALHLACNFQLDKIAKILIDNNIDINAQDSEHEFTPLHYSVNLDNKFISKYLISKNANPNIQDFLGNTALHYAIIEMNIELINLLLFSEETKAIINLNINNYESNLPIHILLSRDDNLDKLEEIIEVLIKGSNLNFSNLNGDTPLHLISENSDLWNKPKFRSIIEKKKLNIFIKNNINMRPVDLVPKNLIEEYLEMATSSYIYVLRNSVDIWSEKWENLCKKELFVEDLDPEDMKEIKKYISIKNDKKDLCLDIIKNKIKKLYETPNIVTECNNSYPSKSKKICKNIDFKYSLVESCSFVGSTLDVLIGIIYLLKNHNNLCSTIDSQFIDNEELCKYYKNIGISSKTSCEFMNFEAVWVLNKLHFSSNFYQNFKKCREKKRFVILPLGIELRNASHANYLIYDNKINEMERFEPFGSNAPYKFDYNDDLLDKLLEKKLMCLFS